jgi:hypothetical protein
MKASIIMVTTKHHANPAGRFRTNQKRINDIISRCAHILTRCQSRRKNRYRRMANIGKMRIIIIQRMRNRAIGKGGSAGWQTNSSTGNCRAWHPAFGHHKITNNMR